MGCWYGGHLEWQKWKNLMMNIFLPMNISIGLDKVKLMIKLMENAPPLLLRVIANILVDESRGQRTLKMGIASQDRADPQTKEAPTSQINSKCVWNVLRSI